MNIDDAKARQEAARKMQEARAARAKALDDLRFAQRLKETVKEERDD